VLGAQRLDRHACFGNARLLRPAPVLDGGDLGVRLGNVRRKRLDFRLGAAPLVDGVYGLRAQLFQPLLRGGGRERRLFVGRLAGRQFITHPRRFLFQRKRLL